MVNRSRARTKGWTWRPNSSWKRHRCLTGRVAITSWKELRWEVLRSSFWGTFTWCLEQDSGRRAFPSHKGSSLLQGETSDLQHHELHGPPDLGNLISLTLFFFNDTCPLSITAYLRWVKTGNERCLLPLNSCKVQEVFWTGLLYSRREKGLSI